MTGTLRLRLLITGLVFGVTHQRQEGKTQNSPKPEKNKNILFGRAALGEKGQKYQEIGNRKSDKSFKAWGERPAPVEYF